MKKVRLVLSALAIMFAVAAAFAFNFAPVTTQDFRLDESTGDLFSPVTPVAPNSTCIEDPVKWCARTYNVDTSGNPTTPDGDRVHGIYIIP